MMKARVGLLALLVGTAAVTTAQAVPVDLVAFAPQTATGQVFDFVFATVPESSGSGTFTVHARGDYSSCGALCADLESMFWSIDGLSSGNAGPEWGATILLDVDFNDREWTQTFSIPAVGLALITADGLVTFHLELGSSVNEFLSANPFVNPSLSYESATVPEPGSVSLLTVGAALLRVLVHRRSKN